MNKKNVIILLVVILIIILLIIFGSLIRAINNTETENNTQTVSNTSNQSNNNNSTENNTEEETEIENEVVIIKNGKIENEDLIDEFLYGSQDEPLEIDITENGENTVIQIQSVPSTSYDENNSYTVGSSTTEEEYESIYGYYSVTINGQTSEKYNKLKWDIKRVTEGNTVGLIFHTYADETYPVICEYDLDTSSYDTKIEEIEYTQENTSEIEYIAFVEDEENDDNDDDDEDSNEEGYNVYTYGGSVNIELNGNTYSLKTALDEGIITGQDILDKIEMDLQYGLCEANSSTNTDNIEYLYNGYTIALIENAEDYCDIYIGMEGSWITEIEN